MMSFPLLVNSNSCPHLRRLLRDRATRDIDKPGVQPVNEPESVHIVVVPFPKGWLGKLRAGYVEATSQCGYSV